MLNIFGNIFKTKNSDGSLNKPTLFGYLGLIITGLGAVDGGPELLDMVLNSFGQWKPLVLVVSGILSGALANTKPD